MTELIKTVHSHKPHHVWDASLEPVMSVRPGEEVQVHCRDVANGHYNSESTHQDVLTCDIEKAYPLTGPIYVEGCKPGDVLQISILDCEPSGFGWTDILPDFGLLQDDFSDPYLRLWKYDPLLAEPVVFNELTEIPLQPTIGTIGVARVEEGSFPVAPPSHCGGNLDIKDTTIGSKLYLPVQTEGALLSLGDSHAAQGDGEVCGTGIETAMNWLLRLEVVKDLKLTTPVLEIPGKQVVEPPQLVTTGIGPDLKQAAIDAVRAMIELITAKTNCSPEDAYILCSVAADLKISELVNDNSYVVSFYLTRMFDLGS